MEFRVVLLDQAKKDLRAIYQWIEADTSIAARTWYLGLRQTIRSLKLMPQRALLLPSNSRYRQLHYGNKNHIYSIIFRILENEKLVLVVHIRHGARSEEYLTDFLN